MPTPPSIPNPYNYNIIGFSHHYTKLWGQVSGVLIDAQCVKIRKDFPVSTRYYDTAYETPNGKEH